MPADRISATDELIDHLIAEFRPRFPAGHEDSIEAFLRHYYARVALEDLLERDPLDLYGAALAHWHLSRVREPDRPAINVYNPDFENHGWQSTHTVIEVVTDDMPFLVDSVSMALNQRGLTIHLTVHPVLRNLRDQSHAITRTLAPGEKDDPNAVAESYMQYQVDRQTEPAVLASIEKDIYRVLRHVRQAYRDWPAMRDRVAAIIDELSAPKRADSEDVIEAIEFCRWISDDHFTFLGYCQLELVEGALVPVAGTGLGVLSEELTGIRTIDALPGDAGALLEAPRPLLVTKANSRSTVHRPAYMDLIVVRRGTNGPGSVHCILGLFTSAAYNRNTRDIPLLRRKVARLMEHSALPAGGHAWKALQNIVENYPRDGLFQISEDELVTTTLGILALQERQHIRVFVRRDRFRRFWSCLVYVPRERFTSDLRMRIQELLIDALGGYESEFDVQFSESVLARIHIVVRTDSAAEPKYDLRELERRVAEASRLWRDDLADALIEQNGEEQGNRLFQKYRRAFPTGYQEDNPARRGAFDVQHIEKAARSGSLEVLFYRPLGIVDGSVRLKLYSPGQPLSLSDILPMIENMGLTVSSGRPYRIHPADGIDYWINEFHLRPRRARDIDVDQVRENFETAFLKVWHGNIEDDGFNQLVLQAGLSWRETVILRAYFKYLRQIRIRYSKEYVIETLVGNPNMSGRLVRLFHALFDPHLAGDRRQTEKQVLDEINGGLERVVNLDEDRILRSYLNVIQATLRTNFYQPGADGGVRDYVSFKFNPRDIQRMPEPRPMFEIFVYSPEVEAIHLRGGKVARGGLRWSDRPEDFRTEVLGLVKAQMVKNAVIVPVGSKGGFVVKRMPEGDRETQMNKVIDCYKTFIRGMLDITDNLSGADVVPPSAVVRYDDDDPYLVVAADKGTATFSDIANGVAREYGFWLDDAFASGGSSGYDHKKMGITARGAWESVKRHFRELGHDVQSQPFTAVGIGDMSGDVFGNGMLLSRQIRLVAAFNHLHVFLDPNPDPAASFKERERLFRLPRSSWEDYNTKLISEGGGIFRRTAKSIPLSPQVRERLAIKETQLTPNELISAILRAPVDLLWNGGIGTYVKAAAETHDQVRDRANDALRVDGRELRCKVVGEGGNLGMTQLGRIEYSRKGGLCYTDAIDNSGGVDTSDHEVNIKILLNSVVAAGDMTMKQRDALLEEMTEEVARLVLADNYGQTEAVSLAATDAAELFQQHVRLIRQLERRGVLNRVLEFLPDEETIAERINAQEGLCRPELAVLLAYSKLTLYQELLTSDAPEDPYLSQVLYRYFPVVLSQRHRDRMEQHRLRREIIATYLTNNLVNRVGPSFVFRLSELTGSSSPEIARAFAAVWEVFELGALYENIESLDNVVPDAVQKDMLRDAGGLIERATTWLLRNRPAPIDIASTVEHFRDGVRELARSYPRTLAASNRLVQKRRVRTLLAAGAPGELANRVASLIAMSSALDIVDVAATGGHDIASVAAVYYNIGEHLSVYWLREQIAELRVANHWHSLAKFTLRNELHKQQRQLTAEVLGSTRGRRAHARIEQWVEQNRTAADRFAQLIADFRSAGSVDFPMLSVAISELQTMLRGAKA